MTSFRDLIQTHVPLTPLVPFRDYRGDDEARREITLAARRVDALAWIESERRRKHAASG
jgi:hypothetical protein